MMTTMRKTRLGRLDLICMSNAFVAPKFTDFPLAAVGLWDSLRILSLQAYIMAGIKWDGKTEVWIK